MKLYSYWRFGEIRGGGERGCELGAPWCGGEPEREGVAESPRRVGVYQWRVGHVGSVKAVKGYPSMRVCGGK